MAITTRRAAPADAAELHDLAARTFGLATPPGTLQSDVEAFIAEHLARSSFAKYLADPARILLVAEDGGTAVGYSMLISGPIADPDLAAAVSAAAADAAAASAPPAATAGPAPTASPADATPAAAGAAPNSPVTADGTLVAADATPAGTSPVAIELSKFYVSAENHGSGVATTLMAATLEAAAATGAQLCWLGVNQLNDRAARFYAKHGFEIIGTKRFLVGAVWHDDHVRARSL